MNAVAGLVLAGSTGAVDGTLSGRSLQKNVQLVYLEKVDGADATKLTEGAALDQKGNVYHPHVLPVVAGSTVSIKSSDPELHNVFAQKGTDVLFNSGMPAGSPPRVKTFEEPGVVAMSCSIHKEMSAFVVVLQNRFFTQPDKAGKFRIEGVPTGNYVLRIWGEKLEDALLEKKFDVKVPSEGAVTLEITPAT
jgi:plastocyanin